MTQDELTALCQRWQKRLRLSDWRVKVRFARAHELEGLEGDCSWTLPRKIASIRVLDPIDANPGSTVPLNEEETLVHELLHLHFAPFRTSDDSLEDVAQEQAIDLISVALVEAVRNPEEQV